MSMWDYPPLKKYSEPLKEAPPKYTIHGVNYAVQVYSYGSVIIVSGARIITYLWGEEADELLDEIEQIEELDYPRGPFNSAEELIDEYLSAYDC